MGNFISNFDTMAEFEAFKNSANYKTPHLTLTKDNRKLNYVDYNYYDKYFTFVAREQGTFKLTIGSAVPTSILESISYSTDNGENWTTTNNIDNETVTITTSTINKGSKVLWKGIGIGISTTINNSDRPSTSSIFSSTGEFDVQGNIMSLIYGDDFEYKDYVAEGSSYNFSCMFYSNTGHVGNNYAKLISAKNLYIPIKTLSPYCFCRAFQDNGLLYAPHELYGTTLGNYCYQSMFYHCTSLISAPKLPATTLATYCYAGIFMGCTSLASAPELPSTTLSNFCYFSMFSGCTSLASAPELPATTLSEGCYINMFQNCSGLITAPELPSTTLSVECYNSMFSGCTSLITAPDLLAPTLLELCYAYMFENCTSLNNITCLATNISAEDCTWEWTNGVATNGTFIRPVSMSSTWTTGISGIPSGWTIQDAA